MRSQAFSNNKWIKYSISSLLTLIIVACSDSKDFKKPKSPTDTTPPNIESSYPDEKASENFEVDFKVEVVFSELMNIDSLLNGGVQLFSGKREQDSDLEVEPREAIVYFSVVPVTSTDIVTGKEIQIPATKLELTSASGRFALNNSYTVTINDPGRDLVEDDLQTDKDERNFLPGESVIDFKTEAGEWKSSLSIPNVSVENSGTSSEALISLDAKQFSPKLISNTVGGAALIWRQELTPGISQLWMSRYTPNTKKWGLVDSASEVCDLSRCANAELISTISSTNVLEFDAAMNDLGHIAVTWSQANVTDSLVSIWAKLFDGTKWLSVHEVSGSGLTRTGDADSPQVAIDPKGNVVSIWREHLGAYSRIKTNIFKLAADELLSNGQWSEPPSYIDNLAEVTSKPPKLQMSNKGLAIAVWAQKATDRYRVVSNHLRLNQSDDWFESEYIDTIVSTNPEFNIGNASLPEIAIDQNNDAIAIWLKHDGQRNNLWYNRFTGSWGAVANYVERDRVGDAAYPSIMFSKSNKALAIWTQEDKSSNSHKLVSSFFTATENGWEENETIALNSDINMPVAHFDREGNAIVMWQEGATSGDLKTSYYSKLSEKWGKTESIDTSANNLSITPLYEDGRFLAAWEEVSLTDSSLKSALFSD